MLFIDQKLDKITVFSVAIDSMDAVFPCFSVAIDIAWMLFSNAFSMTKKLENNIKSV